MIPQSNTAVVVDANVLISLCSNEPTFATAANALSHYAIQGCVFYAPSVIVSEVLYVLCVKLQSGVLSAKAYDAAVDDFQDQMKAVSAPPQGETALIRRAKEIQVGYGCSHSADCLYIALAEELSKSGSAEFLTFDKGAVNHVLRHAPAVNVNLLPV
jgi:predicted nucleic acid-binding protein